MARSNVARSGSGHIVRRTWCAFVLLLAGLDGAASERAATRFQFSVSGAHLESQPTVQLDAQYRIRATLTPSIAPAPARNEKLRLAANLTPKSVTAICYVSGHLFENGFESP